MRQRTLGILGAVLLAAGLVLGVGTNFASHYTQTANAVNAPHAPSMRHIDEHQRLAGGSGHHPGFPGRQHP